MPSDREISLWDQASALVREAGYNVCRLHAENAPQDEAYSRSCDLYRRACALLRLLEPIGAEEFIQDTYCPFPTKES